MSSVARRAKVAQGLRHLLRAGVIAFVAWAALNGAWRNFKVAHNSARLVELMEGAPAAQLYAWNEDLLSLFGEPLRASQDFLGIPWSLTVFGMQFPDPIMALSFVVSNGALPVGLVLGALLPLVLALTLGKVFCSHICPMRTAFDVAQLVRGGLLRLGIELPQYRLSSRFGGWVLLGGFIATVGIGTAIWLLLLPYASLSATIVILVLGGGGTVLAWVPGILLSLDCLLAPGVFCHSFCPQGFLLEQVGRWSFLRLRNDQRVKCPESCQACVQACPYGLSPKKDTHRPACDNCGACVAICPKGKLARKVSLPIIALVIGVCLPSVAFAHHNKGLPHYGYYENYPQVPTEETVNITGHWEMGATIFNFQGYERRNANSPRDVKFFTYLYDLEQGAPYLGPVEFEIQLDGDVVVRFSRETVDEEAIYSTRETLPESGEYEMVAKIPVEGGVQTARIYFEVELNDDKINWWLLLGMGMPMGILFGLALLGRTRRARARRLRSAAKALSHAVLFGLLLGASFLRPASAFAQGAAPPQSREERAPTTQSVHSEHLLVGGVMGAAHDDLPTGAASVDSAGSATLPPGLVMKTCPPQPDSATQPAMKHYAAPDGSMMMVMGGLPPWLLISGMLLLVALSFVTVEWLGLRKPLAWRKNLLKRKARYGVARRRWLQAVPQLTAVVVFGFVVYAGLAGNQVRNVAPVFVWTIWWAGLIFAVLLVGPVFCFACPWDGLANLVTRLGGFRRIEPLSLELSVPRWLRSTWPALTLFAILTWAELGLQVTTSPKNTAYMGLAMAALAVTFALTFEKKAFCRYVCPVGRITGIYSNFSPVELRRRNANVCERCTTEECLNGNERGYPCPTGLSLKVLNQASYCTGCTECIKSCDKRNVAINLRPFGADLNASHSPRVDEASLCLGLLALTLFHGLSMTTTWESFEPGSSSVMRWMRLEWGLSAWAGFSLGMLAALCIPVALYWLSCFVGARVSNEAVSTRTLFLRYSTSLLPIALFYHLAHNAMHLLSEGGNVVALLSDPLGHGTDYFGTRDLSLGHLVSESTLWYLQVGLILIGHVGGVVVAHRTSREVFSLARNATRSLVPMLVVMLVISAGGLSLMGLDMNMRMGRM